MESVTRLLSRAWLAGLSVELDGGDLKIAGPRAAETIVDEFRARKTDVVAHLQAQGCGSLHIKPERWVHRDGKAYCPRCERYLGHVVNKE